MKNSILIFFLGVFVTISLASTTYSLTEVFPSKPKETIVETFVNLPNGNSGYNATTMNNIKKYIDKKSSEGYILKSLVMSSNGNIVVFEKY